jgi:hypothetical protein
MSEKYTYKVGFQQSNILGDYNGTVVTKYSDEMCHTDHIVEQMQVTEEEIYHALLGKRREVVICANNKITTTQSGGWCRVSCMFAMGEGIPICLAHLSKDNKPTGKCPGAGSYELILRKKGE